MNDDFFEAAVRDSVQRQNDHKTDLSMKHDELREIEQQIKRAVAAALEGTFFGQPRDGYEQFSNAHFPHVNFSIEFGVPGNPRVNFMGEVRWIAGGWKGGHFESHSRCSVERKDRSDLGEVRVPETLSQDGQYMLDGHAFKNAIAEKIRSSRLD